MPPPVEIPNLHDLIKRYEAGEPINHLCREAGVCGHTLKRHFGLAGVKTRNIRDAAKLANTAEIPYLPEIVARYNAGEPITTLSVYAGVSEGGLRAALQRAGVEFRTRAEAYALRSAKMRGRYRVDAGADLGIIGAYEGGESLLSLSRRTGLSRGVILTRLRNAGIEIRGRSDAERLKWAALRKDPKAVAHQCEKAWRARRGSKDSPDTAARRAKTRHERKCAVHSGESEIATQLRTRGVQVEQQFPVGRYNLDVGIPSRRVSVEVVGSPWHPTHAAVLRQRTEHLLGAGWLILFVLKWRRSTGLIRPRNPDYSFAPTVRTKPRFDPAAVAEYAVALLDRLDRNEPLWGQYGMISGNAEPVSAPSRYLDGFARIPEPTADHEPPLNL